MLKTIIKSLTLTCILISAITVSAQCPSMLGTYTIGIKNSDFIDLQSAIDALMCGGVEGNVSLKLMDNVFYGQIHIGEIPGLEKRNRLTIESMYQDPTKTVFKYNSDDDISENHTLYINGTDNITFRNFTIENHGFLHSRLIELADGANNIHFEGMVFNGNDNCYDGRNCALILSDILHVNNNLKVTHSTFNGGAYGIKTSGYPGIQNENGLMAKFNEFNDQTVSAISVRHNDDVDISTNIINSNSENYGFKAITLINLSNKLSVKGNVIMVQNGEHGILINSCMPKAKYASISNNSINVGNDLFAYGIKIIGVSDNLNLNFNRIKFLNPVNSDKKKYYVNESKGSNIMVTNNILFDMNGRGLTVIGNNFENVNAELYRIQPYTADNSLRMIRVENGAYSDFMQ